MRDHGVDADGGVAAGRVLVEEGHGGCIGARMHPVLVQGFAAVGWYVAVVALTRLAGKRFAGQTSIIDLVVLITLGVVLQGVLLQDGPASAAVFVIVVFAVHRGLAIGCRQWPALRHLLRGRPRLLINNGVVDEAALVREDVSLADLKAGLRKAGYARLSDVKTATLEETGWISAVGKDDDGDGIDDDDVACGTADTAQVALR